MTPRSSPVRNAKAILEVSAGVLVAPIVRAAAAFHAVPVGQHWRRACDACGAPLRYPWMSRAFLPPGRCGACGRRISAPGWLVEVGVLVVIIVLVLARRPGWEIAAFAWWALCALALAFVDAAVHRLPNRMTYPAAFGTIALLGVAAIAEHQGHAWVRAVIAATGGAVVFAALALLLGRRGPGLGDAKLMLSTLAVLGWISWAAVVIGLLLSLTAQAIWAAALLTTGHASRSTSLPLGPFLVGGTLLSLVNSRAL